VMSFPGGKGVLGEGVDGWNPLVRLERIARSPENCTRFPVLPKRYNPKKEL